MSCLMNSKLSWGKAPGSDAILAEIYKAGGQLKRPGQYANAIPFPLMLPEKAPKIRRQDKIPDTEVLKRAGMQSVHDPIETCTA